MSGNRFIEICKELMNDQLTDTERRALSKELDEVYTKTWPNGHTVKCGWCGKDITDEMLEHECIRN